MSNYTKHYATFKQTWKNNSNGISDFSIGIIFERIEDVLKGKESNALKIILYFAEASTIILSVFQIIKPNKKKAKIILGLLSFVYISNLIDLTVSEFNLKHTPRNLLFWEDLNHLLFVLILSTPILIALVLVKKYVV